MRAVISPALFRIHPSENIYWTNYNGLPLDFSSCVTHALAAFPVLCQDVSLLMAVVLTAMQQEAWRRRGGSTMAEGRVGYVSFSSASPSPFSPMLFLSGFRYKGKNGTGTCSQHFESEVTSHLDNAVAVMCCYCQKPSVSSHLYFPTGMQTKPKSLKVTLKTFLCQIFFFFFFWIIIYRAFRSMQNKKNKKLIPLKKNRDVIAN